MQKEPGRRNKKKTGPGRKSGPTVLEGLEGETTSLVPPTVIEASGAPEEAPSAVITATDEAVAAAPSVDASDDARAGSTASLEAVAESLVLTASLPEAPAATVDAALDAAIEAALVSGLDPSFDAPRHGEGAAPEPTGPTADYWKINEPLPAAMSSSSGSGGAWKFAAVGILVVATVAGLFLNDRARRAEEQVVLSNQRSLRLEAEARTESARAALEERRRLEIQTTAERARVRQEDVVRDLATIYAREGSRSWKGGNVQRALHYAALSRSLGSTGETTMASPAETLLTELGTRGPLLWNQVVTIPPRKAGSTEPAPQICFDDARGTLVVARSEGPIATFSVESGKPTSAALEGPTGGLVAISLDGRRWVSGAGYTGPANGVVSPVSPASGARPTGIALDLSGRWAAWGDSSSSLTVHDLEAGREAWKQSTAEGGALPGTPLPVRVLAFSPAARYLATDGHGNGDMEAPSTVCLWDMAGGKLLAKKGVPDGVLDLDFTIDERGVWIAGSDPARPIRRLTIPGLDPPAQTVPTLTGHGLVVAARFSPDGHSAALAFEDSTLCLVDRTEQSIRLLFEAGSRVETMAFDRDGNLLATLSRDGSLSVWRVGGWDRGRRLTALPGFQPRQIAVDAAGGRVVALDAQGDSYLWNEGSGAFAARLFTSVRGGPESVGVGELLEGGALGHPAVLGQEETAHEAPLEDKGKGLRLSEGRGAALAVALQPKGETLAVVRDGADGVELWDARAGELVKTLPGGPWSSPRLTYHPAGGLLVSADRAVEVWDATSGDRLFRWEVPAAGEVRAMACHPARPVLVFATSDGKLMRWDREGGVREVTSLTGGPVREAAVDAASRVTLLVDESAGDQVAMVLEVWDLEARTRVARSTPTRDRLLCLAADAAGTWIAAGGTSGSIWLWSAPELRRSARLEGHGQAVWDLEFGPAEGTLLSAGDVGYLRVWDLAALRDPGSTLAAVEAASPYRLVEGELVKKQTP